MAAKKSGEVGAVVWTLLGFLAGVAATLAIQLVVGGRARPQEHEEAAHPAPVVAVTPKLAAPKRKAKTAEAAASATPAPKLAAASETDQMAEDAAATGMTSRAAPRETPQ